MQLIYVCVKTECSAFCYKIFSISSGNWDQHTQTRQTAFLDWVYEYKITWLLWKNWSKLLGITAQHHSADLIYSLPTDVTGIQMSLIYFIILATNLKYVSLFFVFWELIIGQHVTVLFANLNPCFILCEETQIHVANWNSESKTVHLECATRSNIKP